MDCLLGGVGVLLGWVGGDFVWCICVDLVGVCYGYCVDCCFIWIWWGVDFVEYVVMIW